jgi:pimeloyl-ACP methyl ester carboxylesterase
MTTTARRAHTTTGADTAKTSETGVTAPRPTRGPIVRVVLGSLLTGLAGAAALTLVAFPGAPEHVITGSALLAFAAGWAMLAVLSTRLTSQPQRWAFVPAAVMAVTGLGLITFAPGNSGLTHAGWIWPPVMFALAAWMGVQMRRALTGRVRWLLYPVIAALALASVGGAAETVALHNDAASMAMPGTSYDVGGHRLHLHCTGTGSPTVVLESGLGEMSSNWARIAPAIARTTRVCAYDRAGQGWSDDAAHPQDGLVIARDLHTLLAAAGERAPFVLVGHSTGGTYAMTYAAHYPSQVAGMVLLDSSTPDQFSLPGYASTYAMMRRGLGVAPSLARLGIGLLVPQKMMSNLPAPAAAQVSAFTLSPRGLRNMRDEVSVLPAAFAQANALHTLGRKPMAVLTATESLRDTTGWAAAQNRLAALSSNSSHRVIDATHAGLLDDEGPSGAAALAITDVVHAVRTRNPLSTR